MKKNNSPLSIELFKIEQYVEMALSYVRLNSDSTDYLIKEYDIDDIVKQAVRKYAPLFIAKKNQTRYRRYEHESLDR